MKKVLFLLLALLGVLFSSCNTDEETKELSAQEKAQMCLVLSGIEFEDSDYGKYPLEFIVCSTNWLIGVSIPSGSIAGPIPSEPSFSIRITDFKIN
mgnify:CR=1 FL=1